MTSKNICVATGQLEKRNISTSAGKTKVTRFSKLFLLICLIFYCDVTFAEYRGLYGLSLSDSNTGKPGLSLGIGGDEYILCFSAVFNSEYSDKDLNNTSIPHNSFDDLGFKRINTQQGIDILKKEPFDLWPETTIIWGAGIYSQKYSKIAKSKVTGLLWSQETKSDVKGAFDIGLLFQGESTKQFGFIYNSVRGLGFILEIKL